LVFLPKHPGTIETININNAMKEIEPDLTKPLLPEPKKTITICTALLVPGVAIYSLCFACTKFVNYALFFWLPYFLEDALNFPLSLGALLSSWYDFGGLLGGFIVGFSSDILLRKFHIDRSFVLFVTMILSSGILYLYISYAGVSIAVNIILMIWTGIMIGGPNNIISSAVSNDLGEHPYLKGNRHALATITGVIDGIASAGAALGQTAIAALSPIYGWNIVFYIFMVVNAIGGVVLLPVVYRTWKKEGPKLPQTI